MAISSYTELKAAVQSWLDRADLDAYVDDFILLAEDHLNREVKHRRMIATTDLTPSSNVCTLPTDYLHYVRVVELAANRRKLDYISPEAVDSLYPSRISGLSDNFTIVGNTLTAYPLSSNDIELTYKQKIPALTSDNTTNWLLTASPGLYLRATQVQALLFINETDTSRATVVSGLYARYLDQLNEEGDLAQYYAAGIELGQIVP